MTGPSDPATNKHFTSIEKTALVVVDAQKGFIGKDTAHVVPKLVQLVSGWNELGGATIFTRNFNYSGSPLETLVDYTLMYGPPETDIIDELTPFVGTVIDKTVYSFFTKDGTALVKQNQWTTLIFCGLDTEACVLKSAFDAFDLGIVPLFVADATASSFGPTKHEAGLSVAEAVLGERQITTVNDLLSRFGMPEDVTDA